MIQKPQYIRIAEELAEKIKRGFYQPGEKIFSQNELADFYKVSVMVSYKVHSLLLERGYVKKIHGKGVFVTYRMPPKQIINPGTSGIKKVVVFYFAEKFNPDPLNYASRIVAGIKKRAADTGLSFRIEFINLNNIIYGVLPNPPELEPDEGCIIIYNGVESVRATATYLFDTNVRTVLVNSIIPGSACVMSDNYHGVRELLKHIVSKGYKRIAFAPNMALNINQVTVAEMIYAFKVSLKDYNVDGEIIYSDIYNDLLDIMKSQKTPTAFMFSDDLTAIRVKELARFNSTSAKTYITGFGDYVSNPKNRNRLAELTTYHDDCEKMGEESVDILLVNPAAETKYPVIKHIPGHLVVRENKVNFKKLNCQQEVLK